ncbi:MAG TPA: hypothetical protein VLQ80_14415 [Candidatus Saccharimonadia bacterium]|nr:hypothetical protein [Candidatus Saccharimonadia bacterium]
MSRTSKVPITKAHKMSPPDTSARLSMEQKNAIELLVQGRPDHEVAAAIGVARETICRWRLNNPYFMATLNQERQTLWEHAHQRLRGLVNRSIDILEHALSDGDVKAAIELLKIVRIYGEVPAPGGAVDPEQVVFDQVQAWHLAVKRRDLAPVDPVQVLLDPHAGDDAARLHDRLQAARQAWGMDEEGA